MNEKITIKMDLKFTKEFLEYLFSTREQFSCGFPQSIELFIREFFNSAFMQMIAKKEKGFDSKDEPYGFDWSKISNSDWKKIILTMLKKSIPYNADVEIESTEFKRPVKFNINKQSGVPGESPVTKKRKMTWGLDSDGMDIGDIDSWIKHRKN